MKQITGEFSENNSAECEENLLLYQDFHARNPKLFY